MQWQRGERSSTPLLPFSWERPQGSISQPAITRSQNDTLPPTFKAVAALFNTIHRLLNRGGFRTGCAPCCKVARSNRDTCLCLIGPLSQIFKGCEWVWSVALKTGRSTGFVTLIAEWHLRCFVGLVCITALFLLLSTVFEKLCTFLFGQFVF